MSKKPIITKQWLEKHYIEADLTAKQCADLKGTRKSTIVTHITRYGLQKTRKTYAAASRQRMLTSKSTLKEILERIPKR